MQIERDCLQIARYIDISYNDAIGRNHFYICEVKYALHTGIDESSDGVLRRPCRHSHNGYLYFMRFNHIPEFIDTIDGHSTEMCAYEFLFFLKNSRYSSKKVGLNSH